MYCLILFVVLLSSFQESITINSPNSFKDPQNLVPSVSSVHSPIELTEDAQLESFADKTGGDGNSWITAYVIEDFELAYIHLSDISYYLIIENCTLNGIEDNAIQVSNCPNLIIRSCNISGGLRGMFIQTSPNVQILNNNIENCQFNGIYIDTSSFSNISINQVHNNMGSGIYYEYCDNIEINANNCSSNDLAGIQSYGGMNATIINNTVQFNTGSGIEVQSPNEINITNNTLYNNLNGIYINGASFGNLENNTINTNMDIGIFLRSSVGLEAHNNLINANLGTGIYCYALSDSKITSNKIFDNGIGLWFDVNSQYNLATLNEVFNNFDFGLCMQDSSYNSVYLNSFYGNINGEGFQIRGIGNRYDDYSYGNYWGDYLLFFPDACSNGLFYDLPYELGELVDYFPLVSFFNPNVGETLVIHNDTELAEIATRGVGTIENPYVIENKIFNSYMKGNCIEIINTTKSLFIQNCTLIYPSSQPSKAAIYLENCSNIQIFNCSSPSYTIGILGSDIINLIIENCTFSNGNYGIYLNNVYNVNISSCDVSYNHNQAIHIQDGEYTTISSNKADHAITYGIIVASNHSLIENNDVSFSSNTGISIAGGRNHTLLENNVSNSFSCGINVAYNTYDLSFSGNVLDYSGIVFSNKTLAFFSTISLDSTNTINGKPVYYYFDKHFSAEVNLENAGQILLVGCSGISIDEQIIYNTTTPISLFHCVDVNISNGLFYNNSKDGIYLYNSILCTLASNTILNNSNNGLIIEESSYNTILTNNLIFNYICGLALYSSDNNFIDHNNISQNFNKGVSVFESNHNTIQFCNIDNNFMDVGISLGMSNNNSFNSNTVISNQNYAIVQSGGGQSHFINNYLSSDTGKMGIALLSSSKDIISQNKFEGFETAINLGVSNFIEISGNQFSEITQSGILIGTNNYEILLDNNTFVSIPYAVVAEGISYCIFSDNSFILCQHPIRLINSYNNSITDNLIDRAVFQAIYLMEVENNTINGNSILYPGTEAIYVDTSRNDRILDNILVNGTGMGLYLQNCEENVIRNNSISGFDSYSIYLISTTEFLISENNVFQNIGDGILISNSHSGIIHSNRIEFQSEMGIRLISSNYTQIVQNYIVNITYKAISISGIGNNISENLVGLQIDIFSDSGDNIISKNIYLLEDLDNDGLLGFVEYELGTDTLLIDTDNDNFLDGYEFLVGTDPTDPTDTPIMPQYQYNILVEMLENNMTQINFVYGLLQNNWTYLQTIEMTFSANLTEIESILLQLGLMLPDMDCDGLSDLREHILGTNPLASDTDLDMLSDAFEIKIGTDPLNDDSDNDGFLDGIELFQGFNPLDSENHPEITNSDTTTESSGKKSISGFSSVLGILSIFSIIGILIALKRKRN